MEIVLHLLGTCSDTHSHIDLLDFMFMGGLTPALLVVKYRWKNIKAYFKTKKNG